MKITVDDVITWLIVGALAGWLAGMLVKRRKQGFGHLANLGIGLVSAGAVLVVAGAVTFFVWPAPQSTTAQRAVKPVVGQNQWGLSFEGTW